MSQIQTLNGPLSFEEPMPMRKVSLMVEWYETPPAHANFQMASMATDTGRRSRLATLDDVAKALGVPTDELKSILGR